MARKIWDPRKTLGLCFREDDSLYCVGRALSQLNSRCRYKLPDMEIEQVMTILNHMSTHPPNQAHIALPRLAKLCLCPRNHQCQKTEVIVMWKKRISRAQREYEEGQHLRTENLRLLGKLAEERHEIVRLQEIVDGDSDSDDEKQEEITQELEDLKARLIIALHEAARYQEGYLQVEADNTTLKSQNEFLEVMYDQRVRETEQLEIILEDQTRKFSVELEAERGHADEYRVVLEQGRKAFQELQNTQESLVESIEMDIADKIVMLQQHQAEVRTKAAQNRSLVQQLDGITEKLDAESNKRRTMQTNLDQMSGTEYTLTAKVGALEAQLAAERRRNARLERAADAAERARSDLEENYESLREQAEQERETLARAHEQLEEEVKQHARLTIDLRNPRHASIASDLHKYKDSLQAYSQQVDVLSKQRDSLQSHLTLERTASTRVQGDLAASASMQSMLMEEIKLLRQQLEATDQMKAEQDEMIGRLQAEKMEMRAQMETQEIINDKLNDILNDFRNDMKTQQERYTSQLESAHTTLRHTQQQLATAALRNEHLLAAVASKQTQVADLQSQMKSFKYLVAARNHIVAGTHSSQRWLRNTWEGLMQLTRDIRGSSANDAAAIV